jgi:hypothetical protein
MKYILILSILGAFLGGCAVAPGGYGDRERGYDGNYRYRDYNDGNYHHYSYRGGNGNQGEPYRGS